MGPSECRAAIEGFASADPAKLRALPAACTLADVAATLRSLEATADGLLGAPVAAFDIHFFASDKIPQIRAWLDRAGHLALLDAEWPPASADDYVHALGEPAGRLDYRWHDITLADAELVWAERGVVVVSSPDIKGVIRAGLFVPRSLAEYQRTVRYIPQPTDDE